MFGKYYIFGDKMMVVLGGEGAFITANVIRTCLRSLLSL